MQERIAEILFDIWLEAKQGETDEWDGAQFTSLPEKHKQEYYKTAHRIYNFVLQELSKGMMGEGEIIEYIDFEKERTYKSKGHIVSTFDVYPLLQAQRTRAQCEKEKQAKERILNPTVLLLSAPNVERPRNFNSNLVLWR